jgi:hypothetical protein
MNSAWEPILDAPLLYDEYERYWDFDGGHRIAATLPIQNGIPQPQPMRVLVTSPDGIISIVGGSKLAKAFIIAAALRDQPIRG